MCSHPNTALANCGISTSSYITHQYTTTTSDTLPQTSRPASQLCFYQCRPKYKTKENHWKLIQEDLVREQILLISLNSLRCGKVLRVGSVWGRCVNCKLGTVLNMVSWKSTTGILLTIYFSTLAIYSVCVVVYLRTCLLVWLATRLSTYLFLRRSVL